MSQGKQELQQTESKEPVLAGVSMDSYSVHSCVQRDVDRPHRLSVDIPLFSKNLLRASPTGLLTGIQGFESITGSASLTFSQSDSLLGNWHNDDALLARDHDVATLDLYATALYRAIECSGFLLCSKYRNNAPCEQRKTIIMHLGEIADHAIHDECGDA